MFYNVEDALDDVARRAGLGLREGHPLYTFRVTTQEAAKLRSSLQEALRRGGEFGPKKCAAFCMYAAQQFCSAHRGGAWKWETVLESVGFQYSTNTLYEIVREGLSFFGRKVMKSHGQRRYLATLACEGGLPLALLTTEHSSLHRFFRHLLADRERFPQANAVELCEDLQHALPQTLRKEEVFALAACLVDAVAQLRRQLGDGADGHDPIKLLDDRVPDWRGQIPLRLEDTVAAELLRGLLKQARDTLTRGHGGLAFDSLLEPTEENSYALRRSLRFPTTIEEKRLGYGNEKLEFPNRFRILATPEGSGPVPVVQAHRLLRSPDATEDLFRLESLGARGITNHLGRISLSIVVDNQEIVRWVPPGGESMSELPWVFADDEERMISRGSGSVSLRDESVLFAISENVLWKKDADTGIDRVGTIAGVERELFRLRGAVQIETRGDLCRLRTASEADEVAHYALRGPRADLNVQGVKVYSGVPKVCQLIDGDHPRQIDARFVQWRPTGSDKPWRPIATCSAGAVSIRLVVDEETRFRATALIVPSSLRVKAQPGPGRNEGCLIFEGVQISSLRVAHDAGNAELSHQIEVAGLKTTLKLVSQDEAPSSVGCRMTFACGGTIELLLPFPTPQSCFVRGDGLKLRHDQRITLDQCYGTRAEVYSNEPTASFKLAAKIPGSQAFHLATLKHDGTHHSVSLDGLIDKIETLLTGAEDVDHEVELMIEAEGFSTRSTRFLVGQFERKFRWDRPIDGEGIVNLRLDDDRYGASFVAEDVTVYAEKLWDLADGKYELPRALEGSWEMTSEDREPGNWLISGWVGNSMRVRPSLVPVGKREVADDGLSLDRIVHMPLEMAAVEFERMFEEMAKDANSLLWNDVKHYAATLGSLPATTYHVIRHLARNADASALAALKFASETWFTSFWTGIEKLPFLWSLVPIGSWVRALAETRSGIEKSLQQIPGLGSSTEQVFAEQLVAAHQSLVSAYRPIAPALEFVARKLELELPNETSMLNHARTAPGRKLLRHLITDGTPGATGSRVQEVITRHHKTRWPSDDVRRLANDIGLDAAEMQELWFRDPNEGRQTILDAPVLAAKSAAEDCELTAQQIATLQRLRGFDAEWFDAAYEMTITTILGQSL